MFQHHIPNKNYASESDKFVEVLQYLSLNDFGCEMLRLLEAEVSLRDPYILFEEPNLKWTHIGPCVEDSGPMDSIEKAPERKRRVNSDQTVLLQTFTGSPQLTCTNLGVSWSILQRYCNTFSTNCLLLCAYIIRKVFKRFWCLKERPPKAPSSARQQLKLALTCLRLTLRLKLNIVKL